MDDKTIATSSLDPVTFEVLRNAFITIVDQMAEQVRRTCYSFVVFNRDFSNGLCDANGDTVALGYGRAVPNPRSRDVQELTAFNAGTAYPDLDTAEQLIELSYGYQATPWLTLRPDVQYIIEPGAFSGESIDNALVLGLQVKAVF